LIAGMRKLTVRHVTVYRYSEPVRLGEHRMMFRPRASHDLRLVRMTLDIHSAPAAQLCARTFCIFKGEFSSTWAKGFTSAARPKMLRGS
jgi:Bacterial transglutaminase-like N-terminal region